MERFREGELVLTGNTLHLPKKWRGKEAIVVRPIPNPDDVEPVYELRIQETGELAEVIESDLISIPAED